MRAKASIYDRSWDEMVIYPAIDIKDGKCVRLVQGRFDDVTVYSDDPVEMACMFERAGAQYLHVVDLDGARLGARRMRM